MPHSILILTNRVPYPLHDGGALAMDAMIRGYAREGWAVHLLAMNTSRHHVAKASLAGLYSDIAGFYTVDVENPVSAAGIVKNLLFSRKPEHADRFRNGLFAKQLRELLRRIKPDVVQLESPFLASYISIIRKESKARLVYRMHNIEAEIWSRFADESKGLKRLYLRNLAKRIAVYERRLWKDADLLLPITAKDAAVVAAAGIQTPMVIAAFGIDMQRNAAIPFSKNGKLKAYHIGAMDWMPNAEAMRWFLAEVWPTLHTSAPALEFHFAGRAMPESFSLNLPENAFCAGEVSDAQAFIADKDVLVVPIRSGGGIRVKILEAMAGGKLVVSTDVGMQGIEAQSDLHYLRANTADDFARLIAWASAHREMAESIGRSAQKLICEQYDAVSIMSRIIQKLTSMIAG